MCVHVCVRVKCLVHRHTVPSSLVLCVNLVTSQGRTVVKGREGSGDDKGVCACVYVCMYDMYVCMYVCTYLCVCMCMYVCMYVCVC